MSITGVKTDSEIRELIHDLVERYTDCHGLETYLFGVSNDNAFLIPLEIKQEEVWTNTSQLPHNPLRITNGELVNDSEK